MILLAETDVTGGLTSGLVAGLVPLLLAVLMRSAKKESAEQAGRQMVAYGRGMKILVMVGWGFTGLVAVLAAMTARKQDILPAVLVVALFVALVLPLHLETFGVRIAWDEQNIYTRSPWRKSRTIPISSIQSCDYSASMQWYRIRTASHGIIRVSHLMSGTPSLLAILPCAHPPST